MKVYLYLIPIMNYKERILINIDQNGITECGRKKIFRWFDEETTKTANVLF